MSAAANTTPIVTTVTKTANKEKTQKERDKVNIQNFCEEHYEDILPIIMDKVRRDKRKKVHTRLDFEESSETGRGRREGSQNSSAGISPVRYHTSSRRPRVQDRLRYNNGNVFNLLSRRRRSVHERLSDTYSPSMTRSRPSGTGSRDPSRIRSRSPGKDRPRRRDHLRNIEGSYNGVYSSQGIRTKYRGPTRDRRRSMSTKRWREDGSLSSRGSESSTSDTGHWAARVWFDELPPESIDSYKDLKAAFLAYFMQQKKHVKDPLEIHNIKQKNGETTEEFIERFKVES
ncbi:reverse transcriptase domain-containing protein [Tanacetum coccineum]|uniref:Reverse transcriptase domain-containing protein n=1 Tax=Tanacetum coccineum TaxID=301880 RepID=A0ABQ5CM06_9ASTR